MTEQVDQSAPAEDKSIVIVDVKSDDDKKTVHSTISFTMTWRNQETGHVKVGTFTAIRPNLGALGRIAVLKAKLNGGEQVDAQTDFLHDMMATLQVLLKDVPDWWTPSDFFDARPLREVWDYVQRWIENFRTRRAG